MKIKINLTLFLTLIFILLDQPFAQVLPLLPLKTDSAGKQCYESDMVDGICIIVNDKYLNTPCTKSEAQEIKFGDKVIYKCPCANTPAGTIPKWYPDNMWKCPCPNSPSNDPWYPVNNICDVKPFRDWDMKDSDIKRLPSVIPPKGLVQECRIFNKKPERSCAARNRTVAIEGNNAETVAKGIASKIGRSTDNTLFNNLKGMLTSYRTKYCGSFRLKGCVTIRSKFYSCGTFLPDNAKNIGTLAGDYQALQKDFTEAINGKKDQIKQILEAAVDKCNGDNTELYNNFAKYTGGTYPTHYEILSGAIDKAKLVDKILLDFDCKNKNIDKKIGKYCSSNSKKISSSQIAFDDFVETPGVGIVFNDNVKTEQPKPCFTSSSRVTFQDSTANFSSTTSINALINEIKSANIFKPTGYVGIFSPSCNVSQIQITSSSSTGSNTELGDFCQKDFINLNKARAEKVKVAIKSNFEIDENLFVDPSIGGKNADGSSGNCTYRCKLGTSENVCEEEYSNPRIADSELNENQNVTVSVMPKRNGYANRDKDVWAGITLRMYRVHYGCEFDLIKDCYEPNSTTGDKGNTIR